MKKLFFTVFVLIIPIFVFAEGNTNNLENTTPLSYNSFLQPDSNGVYDNGQPTLTPYSHFPRGAAFALNLVIGFGLGSFIQGDIFGGIIGLAGDLSVVCIILIGSNVTSNANSFKDGWGSFWSTVIFAELFLLASKIFQGIRPWVYKYPNNLTIAPSLDENGKLTVSTAWHYRY